MPAGPELEMQVREAVALRAHVPADRAKWLALLNQIARLEDQVAQVKIAALEAAAVIDRHLYARPNALGERDHAGANGKRLGPG